MPIDPHHRVLAMGTAEGRQRHHRHRRPRRVGRTLLAILLAMGLVSGGLYAAIHVIGLNQGTVAQKCTALVGGTLHTLSPDQAANAAVIAAGGLATAAGVAAVLGAGAAAVWIGTRFG